MEEETLLIDKTIKRVEFIFRYTGINIRVGEKTRAGKIKSRIVYTVNFIWLNTDVIGAMSWFFVGIAQSKSFTELTYVAPCITVSFLADLKTMYLILHERNIDILIEVLRKFETDERAREKIKEKDDIIKTEHNHLMTIISILNVFYLALVITFGLSPGILVAWNYFTTTKVELVLPFLVIYPFDPFNIRIWPFVYIRQVWSETFTVLQICSADYIFYIFCMYIRMHFRLLKFEIERIIPPDTDRNSLRENEEIRSKFMLLIKRHQDLISAANMLEVAYTRSTLGNFVSSSILICLTGFNVVAIDDVVYIITFLSFLLMCLSQIFFLCFFGDLLLQSSMEVSDAVYNCRWYLANTSLGKDFLLVQTRSQIPCKLTASNFAEVNLRAFMKIMSTAWSYFALLQTLYGSPTEK